MDKKGPKNFGKDSLNITNPKQKRRKGLPSSRACVLSQRLCGVALSRVSRRLCVLGVARLATKKKRKKKSEKKKPRVHRTEARALVCVWTEEDTTEDDQHTKRFQFCIKLTTNESSLRDSRSRSVSRDRRPRRNTTTTTTIMGGDDELAKHTKVRRRRDHLFFFVVLLLVPIGFLFSSSSLQNAKEDKPKRVFFSTIRDYYRFQKEEGE